MKNIMGERFGRWLVTARAKVKQHTKNKPAMWVVKCDCGKTAIKAGIHLRYGKTKSCGCLAAELNAAKDISGQKFGRWTIIARAGTSTRTNSTPALWQIRCDCGTIVIRPGTDLRSGHSKSCGCARNEKVAEIGRNTIREKHPNWKGGRFIDTKGYVLMSKGLINMLYPSVNVKRKMYEHRAVMSQHLGRSLYPNETIHHKNGIRSDNRIENLELHVGAHGPGSTVEDQVTWAKEILKRYA